MVIRPVYSIAVVGLVTELADVVDPADIGLRLDIDLIVAPLGTEPGVSNEVREIGFKIGPRAIDHDMVVKALAIPTLDDRDEGDPLSEALSWFAEDLSAQEAVEVPKILGGLAFIQIRSCPPMTVCDRQALLHRQRHSMGCMPVIDPSKLSERCLMGKGLGSVHGPRVLVR
jgi:hypothetical protein